MTLVAISDVNRVMEENQALLKAMEGEDHPNQLSVYENNYVESLQARMKQAHEIASIMGKQLIANAPSRDALIGQVRILMNVLKDQE